MRHLPLALALLLAAGCDSPGGHITNMQDAATPSPAQIRRAYAAAASKAAPMEGVRLIAGTDGPLADELTILWESANSRLDQKMFEIFIPKAKYGFVKVTMIDKRPGEDKIVNAWHWTK